MVKKSFLLVMFFVFMFLTSGCITINTDGCCSGKNSAQCTKKAAKTEGRKEPKPVKKADDWIKDHFW